MPPILFPKVWPWEWLWPVVAGILLYSIVRIVYISFRYPTQRRRIIWRIVGLLLVVPFVVMPFVLYSDWPSRLWRSQTISETSSNALDPDLRTHYYPLPKRFIFDTARQVVNNIYGWRMMRSDFEAGLISVEINGLFGRLNNDMLIYITELDSNVTQVDVRTSLRQSSSDRGTTDRNIVHFFYEFDRMISQPNQ
jgi:hypothetical protein